jgi:predicted PurR-regulated permease PerM
MTDEVASTIEKERIDSRRLRRYIIDVLAVILAAALILWLLFELRMILLLLVLSTLFAFLLAPLIRPLERPVRFRGRLITPPRPLAVLLVYVLLGVVIVLSGGLLAPRLSGQMSTLMLNLPEYSRRVEDLGRLLGALPMRFQLPQEFRSALNAGMNRLVGGVTGGLSDLAVHVVRLTLLLPWLVLIPVIGYFLLTEGGNFQHFFLQSLPRFSWRFRMAAFLSDVGDALAAYIRAQLMSCLIVGAVVLAGLSALGAPYPVVLGSLAGLFEFVPLVGPLVIMIAATLIASLESVRLGIFVLTFLLVVRGVQDYVIYPRLIGRQVEMHPLLVILAVLCGAELGGVLGVFLSVPVMALLIVAWRHVQPTSAAPQP